MNKDELTRITSDYSLTCSLLTMGTNDVRTVVKQVGEVNSGMTSFRAGLSEER